MTNRVLARVDSLRLANPSYGPAQWLYDALGELATKVTPEEAVALVPHLLQAPVAVYVQAKAFPVDAVRALLAHWPTRAEGWPAFVAALGQGAGNDDELRRRWVCGLEALQALENASGPRLEAAFDRILRDAPVLAALRVWAGRGPWHNAIAVLARDPASHEALRPLVECALATGGERLDQFYGLREHLPEHIVALETAVRARAAATSLPRLVEALGLDLAPEALVFFVGARARCNDDDDRWPSSVDVDLSILGWRSRWGELTVRGDDLPGDLFAWANDVVVRDCIGLPGALRAEDIPTWLSLFGEQCGATWTRFSVHPPEYAEPVRRWLGLPPIPRFLGAE